MQYKLEVEQYIRQIEDEEKSEVKAKKPIHSKRIKNWQSVLIQIEDKIATKDYHEYFMIYNDSDYNSQYFEGYLTLVNKFRNLINNEDNGPLCEFLSKTIKKSQTELEKDLGI
ncbi:hypothetical protein [Aquibacillus saliphilus]|uniref:hypothetical protein n=1 Tax=Aquibacillus saliphilus TaxID=1909422 RepID=UPI001CF02F42|nr:hypothetical protein [Aquibacillus saliphilus]